MKSIATVFFFSSIALGCTFDVDFELESPIDHTVQPDKIAPCPEGNVCLDVQPQDGRTVRPGRVAVMFYQVEPGAPGAPQPEPAIAFDREITRKDQRIEIATSAISAPKDDQLLLCERACDDESSCACRSEGVTVATIVAADNQNGDGRLDAEEIRKSTYGRAHVLIAHSAKEFAVAPTPLDAVFTDGIARGTAAYRFVGSPEERVVRARPDESFVLELCSMPGPYCSLPAPELREL